MDQVRAHFYATIDAISSVTERDLLLDVLPVHDSRNISARILRHGLCVSAFSSLESYLKAIFEKLCRRLSGSVLNLNDFSEKLQRFLIVDSFTGFVNRLSFVKDSQDKISFVQAAADDLAGFNKAPPIFTGFGFSPIGSNVGHEDVKKGFNALGVRNPWGRMEGIARDLGSAVISLENEYKSIYYARHKGAHDPSGNIPTATLQSYLKSALIIGMTADLLADAVGSAIVRCRRKSHLDSAVECATCSFRFLDQAAEGGWNERRPDVGRRVIKKYPDRAAAIANIRSRSGLPNVVVRGVSANPIALA